ncbi:hypothetical protein [Vreelandella venusta]|nr:hypothetical protein [Halomonas venusta]GEK52398.1 hypothetical protein HVE01_31190 [Halomonas venusta]
MKPTTREEFYEWLQSCPCRFSVVSDDVGRTEVAFDYVEDEEEE